MENSFAVSVFDSTRHLCHQVYTFSRFITKGRRCAMQASACREFHAEKRQAILAFAHLVYWKDVRVIEAGYCIGFAAEARERFVRISLITQDPLYGDDPLGVSLTRTINHAHPAAS